MKAPPHLRLSRPKPWGPTGRLGPARPPTHDARSVGAVKAYPSSVSVTVVCAVRYWSPEEFTQAVEKIYGKVRGVSRSSNLWHLHMIALDKVLAPKASASSSMDTDVDQHLAAGPFGGLVLQTASPRLGTGG